MNPHYSSAGKKKLPLVLREKMTEFFIDEIEERDEINEIVWNGLPWLCLEFSLGIVNFYCELIRMLKKSEIKYGTTKPSIGLWNLSWGLSYVRNAVKVYSTDWAVVDGLKLHFFPQFDMQSQDILTKLLKTSLGVTLSFQKLPDLHNQILVENFYLQIGSYPNTSPTFILTPSFIHLLQILSSAISCTSNAVLIEGPTSAGKTSTINYLASLTSHHVIRINNHEHTDL